MVVFNCTSWHSWTSSQQQNIWTHQENLVGIQYNDVFPDWGKWASLYCLDWCLRLSSSLLSQL